MITTITPHYAHLSTTNNNIVHKMFSQVMENSAFYYASIKLVAGGQSSNIARKFDLYFTK